MLGGYPIRSAEFMWAVALGQVPGWSSNTKFGRNPEIDTTSDPEDVWNGGDLYTGLPTTIPGETVDVFSASANDTNASGSGARTLWISGLDDDFNEQSEIIILAGATPVTSVNNYSRLNRAKVLTAGASGLNEGIITIRHTTTTANVFAQLPALLGQTQIAAFTVPAGKKCLLIHWAVEMARLSGAAGGARVVLFVREFGGAWQARRTIETTTGPAGDPHQFFDGALPEKTDVRVHVQQVSDNDTTITTHIDYFLIDT